MTGTMLQFGMGARTCIGKNISLLEIYKLVPTVLRRFEVCFFLLLFILSFVLFLRSLQNHFGFANRNL